MPNIAYDTQRRSFYVTLRGAPGPEGVPRRVVRCYPTLERALQVLNEHQAQRTLSQGKASKDLTVGQWLCYWLENVVRPSRSASTTHGYTMIIRNHLVPALGAIRLDQLTTAQVQDYLNGKQAEGLCSNTVRKHHGVLHNALEARPAAGAHRPQRGRAGVPPLGPDAGPPLLRLGDHGPAFRGPGGHHHGAGGQAGRISGPAPQRDLRTEVEPCGPDRQGHHHCRGPAPPSTAGPWTRRPRTGPPSRRLGYEGLADLEEVIERLWRQREEEKARLGDEYVDRGFVLCHDGGLPYQPDYLSNRLQRVLARTNLPYVTLHGLRHSFASIAHSRNVPLFGISRALGHSSTATTTQIYMHLFDETHLSVVQAVGQAIDPGEA